MNAALEAPSLRSLLRRPDLGLRLESDEAELEDGALDRPIRWIHSTDLADPTPFLSDGLTLLTTGTQFAGSNDEPAVYADYVRRLAARGVLGLGFGTEVVRDGIPPALAEACRTARLPLFEVPYRTPFIAVARAGAEALAAQAYARRTWSLAAQRAISLAALRPDGLGATIAELARQFDAWVGLFDASGTLTREHPADALAAEARAAVSADVGVLLRRGVRAGSAVQAGDDRFTLQTLGHGGHLRGILAIAASDLDQEARGVLTAVIAMAELALGQSRELSRARSLLRAGLVQSLLAGDPALADGISRDLWGPLPIAPVTVALLDTGSARHEGIAELLELRAAEKRGTLFFGDGHDGLVLVVPAGEIDVVEELVARFGVRAGLSDATAYAGFARALDQALIARDRGRAPITAFGQIARAGVLSTLTDDARAVARAELEPLFAHDAATGTRLVETLRAWLDADCSHEASARALGVHRHTIRARLTLIERALGRDLAVFSTRAELWTALRALDAGGAVT